MELRERLYQSSVWCDEVHAAYNGSKEWERLSHIAQDLRDAAAEIEAESSNVRRLHNENYGLRTKVEALEEQLLIARTAANDTDSFREREKKEYASVMTGMRMAIYALAEGLKGGQR